jgi:hypothetical protein
MNNKKLNIINAKTNITNIDLVGETLLKFARRGESIDPTTAALLAMLVAECRNYSTVRDSDTLDDPMSKLMRDYFNSVKEEEQKQENVSASEIADEIINELRKCGINL